MAKSPAESIYRGRKKALDMKLGIMPVGPPPLNPLTPLSLSRAAYLAKGGSDVAKYEGQLGGVWPYDAVARAKMRQLAGEISEYTRYLSTARRKALWRMLSKEFSAIAKPSADTMRPPP